MIHYSAKNLTTQQNYKFLTGSIIPRPIAWITTKDPDTQVVNAAPFSYFNVVAKDLPLISLSINRTSNAQMKDSARNLVNHKEAVVHIVNDQVLLEMNQTAASLPASVGELEDSALTLIPSHSINVPAINEAPIRMETKLHQYIPIKGLNEAIVSDLFILEVMDYYFSPDVFDPQKEYILPLALSPIARLAGESYSHIGTILDIKRPK
ncbi:hypothetical protein NRIC_37870 [Enterococcus florum]|uniref:Flavin reductase like domain-containing protein n=1 Tax=Enterococcus florum TaxID=2480627 RepID=A0A4P5PDA4_9ENTE|nr:flavin reductase family protein [Enterococcus florum]GCF95896.1 hypothetical protein NRIC_37870 [Enterococcus florum]